MSFEKKSFEFVVSAPSCALRLISLGAVLALLASCAATSKNATEGAQPVAELTPVSTEVVDGKPSDADVFADLENTAGRKQEAAAAVVSDDVKKEIEAEEAPFHASHASEMSPDTGVFYSAVGGETPSRVARTIIGGLRPLKKLLKANPDLKFGKKLSKGDKIYFVFDDVVEPQSAYFTKQLLDSYPSEFGAKIEASAASHGLNKIPVVTQKGDTLQSISTKLYGTRRLWTELYLINRSKITNYDKISPGLELVAYDRGTLSFPKLGGASSTHSTKRKEVALGAASTVSAPDLGIAKMESHSTEIPSGLDTQPLAKPKKHPSKQQTVAVESFTLGEPSQMNLPSGAANTHSKEELNPLTGLPKSFGSVAKTGSQIMGKPNKNEPSKLNPAPSLLEKAPPIQANTAPTTQPKPVENLMPQPGEVTQPATPLTKQAKSEPAPVAAVPPTSAQSEFASKAAMEDGQSPDGTNFRRMLYIGLILAIVAAAFFFTRSKKKPKLKINGQPPAPGSGGFGGIMPRPKLNENQDRTVG